MGVGADEEGDAEGVHKAHGLLRGVVVGVAALVESARVELTDAARFGDELQGLEQQVAVPVVGAAEIAFAVCRGGRRWWVYFVQS